MKHRVYFMLGSAAIAGVLAAAEFAGLCWLALRGIPDEVSGMLLFTALIATISAALAAWWMSRHGLRAWRDESSELAIRVVTVALPLFCAVTFCILAIGDPSAAATPLLSMDRMMPAVVVALVAGLTAMFVGIVPAILLETVFCGLLLKHVTKNEATP